MFLVPNLDFSRSCRELELTVATPTDSENFYDGVAGQALSLKTWPRDLQLEWYGLVQADGKPFAQVDAVEFAPASNFTQVFGVQEYAGILLADGTHWVKVDAVDSYINCVEQRLLSLQSNLSQLYHLGPTPEFDSLYSEASQVGVGTRRLRRACRLAAENAEEACRFLAAEIRSAISEKIAYLRRRLRIAKSLRSRLLRLFASVYRFHNQIILQRRYYLAHGSHPIENFTCAQTQWGLGQRGCVPAFLR